MIHLLTGYHFNFFTKYSEPVKWMWYKKYVKHVPLNHKIAKSFEVFLLALFAVNFSLNQIFPKLWLYFRQTWKTQLDLTISLWGFILFNLKGIFCSLVCSNSVRWLFFGKSEHSCLYFWLNVFHLVFYFLYQSLTSFLWAVFYAISCKRGNIVSLGPSASIFVIHWQSVCQCISITIR